MCPDTGKQIKASLAPAVHQPGKQTPSYIYWDKSNLYQDHLANAITNYGLRGFPITTVMVCLSRPCG